MTKQQAPAVRAGTRKERKLLARQIWSDKPGLEVVHKDAAGIDVGSKEHYAAVPPNRDPQPVRCFGCFTSDLHRLADWLIQCGIKTVVLQSTGVYWIPVYDVLEQRGLEVWLVNARETKNLPGRAEFRDKAVKASKETIAKSLEGTWLPEQLAILKRQLADFDHVHAQMAQCDRDLEAMLKQMPSADRVPQAVPPATVLPGRTKKRKGTRKQPSANHPKFNLEKELARMTGVNLTRIDGVYTMTIQTVISEAGLDMSKWETEHHFVSWIGLAPRNEISGGKVLKKKTRKVKSRLATALRMAASTLLKSDSYLGAQYRRLRGRLGPPKAITAMAAKLARLIYRMLKYGEDFVDKGVEHYEQAHCQRKLKALAKQAAQQGFQLVPA